MTTSTGVITRAQPKRSQGIKIHGAEAFEGMRRAGRLARAAEGPGWLGVLVVGTWGPMAIVTAIVTAVTTLAHFACDAPARLSGCFLP
jgi:hypothetical protein